MAVRAIRRPGASVHGHMADTVDAANVLLQHLRSSGTTRWCREQRSVKPSAQPTLVRTQHLPPPAKTARSLRKRGPAGRFLLVPPCVIVCRCRSSRSNRYGQIADSVRAKQAVRGTACFADPRPFCPVTRAPGLLVWLVHATYPGRPVLRRSARTGRRAGLVRTRGRGGLPDRPAPSLRGRHGGGDRVRVARRRVEDWHGAVASDTAGGSGLCTSGGSHVARGSRCPPVRDWIWLSRSCTRRGLMMYLSCTRRIPAPRNTCATENVQDKCLTLMGVRVGGPTQPIAPYRAINYSAEVSL